MILTSVGTDSADTFTYRGLVTEFPPSEIIGSRVARYTSTPWDTTIRWFRFMRYDVQLEQPWIATKLEKILSEDVVASFRNMDDPSIIQMIYELALQAAERQVKVEHFFPKQSGVAQTGAA